MISRKKILSRSQSDIEFPYDNYQCDEDIWYNKDKLFADHIQEILKKWEQIDDEIWGKIICMERNRRIAKAYARFPVLTISGSSNGFDGYKIGLSGFESPIEDPHVKRIKDHVGKGVRVKMDDLGNIIIKRMSHCDVFIRGYERDSNSISKDILDLGGQLEFEKSVKLFDMKKFQNGISKELRSAYPDRRRLENQCINVIAFVKDSNNIMDLPVWCMIINIVALDMLKSKLPTVCYRNESIPKLLSVFDRQDHTDDDPYSVPNLPTSKRPQTTSTKKSEADQKPPELPPRDFAKIKKSKEKKIPKVFRNLVRNNDSKEQRRQSKKEIEYEDPYYCGMQARVSNFGARDRKNGSSSSNNNNSISTAPDRTDMRKSHSSGYLNSLFNPSSNQFKSDPYVSSGDGYDTYAPIYGRSPMYPTGRRPVSSYYYKDSPDQRYATEWD
ncbi:uncharacterized protein LOC141858242 isoform X2 [Brevipalpus obovatus]|uniref:uncharacterized protein LOC141858242 isoform X2 n=1 Tax=Brevipalpus obovatus TaxID=246614 RepID=UPI003D9E4206